MEPQGTKKINTRMKKLNIDWSDSAEQVVSFSTARHVKFLRGSAMVGAAIAGVLAATQSVHAGSIFVIAMENHNLTQPGTVTSPQPIMGNPAAPYLNSLMTPGNPNAIQSSWAMRYRNAGIGVHPSEPNYVWAEAGTDFGIHTDADPRTANSNIFTAPHLTGQFNAAGISWKNYQEDVQLSTSPTNSASGTNGPVNQFYGTTQFNYAVKHNPMAFFTDTATQNVFPLSQLFLDFTTHTVGKYNWITPNQFNDAHSALNGGFTYQGVHYTGDQASIATGDNFLSQIVPQIMATPEYKNNGVIIIWWDESEGGDSTNFAIPEIVISPLAKGNAYSSSVEMSHSSDVKTMEEIFGLPFVNNPIPVAETTASGTGYNNVATVNDLSDLFKDGVIPQVPDVTIIPGVQVHLPFSHDVLQLVLIKNNGTSAVPNPMYLVLDNLSSNGTLLNADGVTTVLAPLGSPFIQVPAGDEDGDDVLRPHQVKPVFLKFSDASKAPITYTTRLLPVTPTP
jgi:phosphatidylinositol-3-phosphatase